MINWQLWLLLPGIVLFLMGLMVLASFFLLVREFSGLSLQPHTAAKKMSVKSINQPKIIRPESVDGDGLQESRELGVE